MWTIFSTKCLFCCIYIFVPWVCVLGGATAAAFTTPRCCKGRCCERYSQSTPQEIKAVDVVVFCEQDCTGDNDTTAAANNCAQSTTTAALNEAFEQKRGRTYRNRQSLGLIGHLLGIIDQKIFDSFAVHNTKFAVPKSFYVLPPLMVSTIWLSSLCFFPDAGVAAIMLEPRTESLCSSLSTFILAGETPGQAAEKYGQNDLLLDSFGAQLMKDYSVPINTSTPPFAARPSSSASSNEKQHRAPTALPAEQSSSGSDMNGALEQMQKQRRVAPLTHG
mmetsp:Transcript_10158/g.13422  ORF Transcript_10158/g.13422 Transcript_10158/m.13422 type:complete len:276 (-) Transcript_10158:102-929(-)